MTDRSEEPRTRVTSFVEEYIERGRHAPGGLEVRRSDGPSGRFAVDPASGED